MSLAPSQMWLSHSIESSVSGGKNIFIYCSRCGLDTHWRRARIKIWRPARFNIYSCTSYLWISIFYAWKPIPGAFNILSEICFFFQSTHSTKYLGRQIPFKFCHSSRFARFQSCCTFLNRAPSVGVARWPYCPYFRAGAVLFELRALYLLLPVLFC